VEGLPSVLARTSEMNHVCPNIQTNDNVLLKDDNLLRNQWQLARVVEAEPDSDDLVRKVKITLGDRSLDQSGQRVKPPLYAGTANPEIGFACCVCFQLEDQGSPPRNQLFQPDVTLY